MLNVAALLCVAGKRRRDPLRLWKNIDGQHPLVLMSRLPYPPREGHQLRAGICCAPWRETHAVTLLSFQRRDDVPAECGPLREIVAQLRDVSHCRGEHSQVCGCSRATCCKASSALRPFVAENTIRRRCTHGSSN